MVQQQHGQAGFVALLAAASERHDDGASPRAAAPLHGTAKPKRDERAAPQPHAPAGDQHA